QWCGPPTSSSRWGAVTRAPSTPAPATRTGSSTTPRDTTSPASVRSVTRSADACRTSSCRWRSPPPTRRRPTMSAHVTEPQDEVAGRLSTLDRYLPLWIGLAMVVGLGIGRVLPDLDEWLDGITIDTVSLPIAVGLLAMMYPVL